MNEDGERERATRPGLLEKVITISLGLEIFEESLRAQGADVIQVDWHPPAGGDAETLSALQDLL